MKNMLISEDIVPIGEFKAHASSYLSAIAEKRGALVITHNGKPAGVVISPQEFDRLTERQRFLESVAAGLVDSDAGRVMESDELLDRLARRRAGRDAE